jgi:hypothetical protein
MSGHDIDRGAAAPEPEAAGLREQLSALVDGGLEPERARFLLRRLQHDAELAGCFERWQLAGDALRGMAPVALPAGFGSRVAQAIAAGPAPASATAGWRRPWALGALAASVAAVALFVARPLVEGEPPTVVPAIATLPEIEVPFAPMVGSEGSDVAAGPVGLSDAGQGARIEQARVEPAAARGASVPAPARPGDLRTALAEPASTPLPTEAIDPFRSPVPPQSRPWPRAVLPGLSGGAADVFTIDHGGRVALPQASGPFAPPAVDSGRAGPQGDEPAQRGEQE